MALKILRNIEKLAALITDPRALMVYCLSYVGLIKTVDNLVHINAWRISE